MMIRAYRPSDCQELAQLFYETVHAVNAREYTPEQLDAWAPAPPDPAVWDASLRAHYTLVAVVDGKLAGFADLDPAAGYLDRLYVHKDYQGRGAAAAMAEALEGYALGRGLRKVTVHASRTARPFFEQRGYRVLYAQQLERRGVPLEDFAMEKDQGEGE